MANFCPECGKPTEKRFVSGLNRDACPDCSFVEFPLASVGIGALVMRDESVLLVERAIPPVGIWTIPSGYVEASDNLINAVIREVREEANVEVTPQGIIALRNHYERNRNDLYVIFLCDADDNQIPVPDGEESSAAKFVPIEELAEMEHLSLTSRSLINHYLEHKPKPMIPLTFDRYHLHALVFTSF